MDGRWEGVKEWVGDGRVSGSGVGEEEGYVGEEGW